MTDVLVVCPANCATGGPEALHEFTSELNKAGVNAKLWYWEIKSDPPMPEEYRSYGCEYVTEKPKDFNGMVIFPEIWANIAMCYPNAAIYWLGLDAYAGWHPTDRGLFLLNEEILHIAQSEYAYDLLKKLKVKRLMKCVDVLNADFYEDYEEGERSDVVLYNPAKATPFMQKLMSEANVQFRPIRGMTRTEVIDAMRHAKLYLDFGEFPGRERIPREAVLCGCCIITSKIGSADYTKDFMHGYKFDSKEGHIWAIVNRIHYVLEHYDECRKDFEPFRQDLFEDRARLTRQVKAIADEIQHHHTGV